MDDPGEAAAYDAADFSDVNAAFVERLRELLPIGAHGTALDLGAGPADISLRFLAAAPAWTVVAVDASFPMLRFAARAAQGAARGGRLWLVMADAKRLPFASGRFECVLSNSILHHVAEPGAFWREAARVARPGATLYVRDLFRPQSAGAARAIVAKYAGAESPLLQEEFYRSLLAAYRPVEVAAQLAESGLGYLDVRVVSDRHLEISGMIRQGG
jgi:ubiquinone/menaquinone biosynthesis C-methylase UbiE